jgi:hypothetical protein
MAGFIDRTSNTGVSKKVLKAIDKLINLGADYEDLLIRQSRAVGPIQAEQGMNAMLSNDLMYAVKLADLEDRKQIAFFEQDYRDRREQLRMFAMNPEIEFILDTITDEAIVYDEHNYFCYPEYNKILSKLKPEMQVKISERIEYIFKDIYSKFRMQEQGWDLFNQWLIDGYLAFEIIFNEDYSKIEGFMYIEPDSLSPAVFQNKNGKLQKGWIQYEKRPELRRELPDEMVIYISFKKNNFTSRTSYVERLTRSFNILRHMEQARVIWTIMNATYRLKMIVPVGSKSPQIVQETIARLMTLYKEDISFDMESGNVTMQGQATLQFYKNYVVAGNQGVQTEISTLGAEGPDLGDTMPLKYYQDKLKYDSKIPFERFNNDTSGGAFTGSAEGISREEQRFGKFINRLRSKFQEILVKPIQIQLFLEYPELANDPVFRSNLSVRFNQDNKFEEAKNLEMTLKRLDIVDRVKALKDNKDENVLFDWEYVIRKYLKYDNEELESNAKYLEKHTPKENEEKV